MEEYRVKRIIELLSLLGMKNPVVREYGLVEKGYVQVEFIFKKLGLEKKHKKFLNFLKKLSMARVVTDFNQLFKAASQVSVYVEKLQKGYPEVGENVDIHEESS